MPEDLNFDKLHEECGVFAIYGHPEAANLTYLGLYALQHRGQESAGIATSDGRKTHMHRGMGHVAEAVRQIRGTSHNQVPNVTYSMCTGYGGAPHEPPPTVAYSAAILRTP